MRKLLDYLEANSDWKGVPTPEEAHYVHFSSERKLNFEISKTSLVLKN